MEGSASEIDVHPIELTVQALLESPLEMLNLNLKSLYESQMILQSILHKMESTLKDTSSNLRGGKVAMDLPDPDAHSMDTLQDLDLNTYLETVQRIRRKLKVVENIITKVETRIGNMETFLPS